MKCMNQILLLLDVFDHVVNPTMKITNNAATQAMWVTLCYYSIEMRSVKVIIESKCLNEYNQKMKKNKVLMFILMVLQTLLTLIIIVNGYFLDLNLCQLNMQGHCLKFAIIDIAARTAKQICDSIFIVLFVIMFQYFFKRKIQKFHETHQKFDLKMVITLVLIWILILANIYKVTGVYIISMLVYAYPQLILTLEIHRYIIRPVIDFITAIIVLNLIQSFASLNQKKHRSKSKKRKGSSSKS